MYDFHNGMLLILINIQTNIPSCPQKGKSQEPFLFSGIARRDYDGIVSDLRLTACWSELGYSFSQMRENVNVIFDVHINYSSNTVIRPHFALADYSFQGFFLAFGRIFVFFQQAFHH